MFRISNSDKLPAKIKVFGIGGCGGNVVNQMMDMGVAGVDYWAINTDAQALSIAKAKEKIQIGNNLTGGQGAGGDPEIGKKAAEEDVDTLRDAIDGAHMLFIVAGMGGGTGTGASPIIASLAREKDILTVAVVTKPFLFEGKPRMKIAEKGIEELKRVVDTILILPNQKLSANKNMSVFHSLSALSAEIPANAVQGISDLIIRPGFINRDFRDLKKVMLRRGKALMGIGEAEGENRALEAVQSAIRSPLLEEVDVNLARAALVNITADTDTFVMQELDEIMDVINHSMREDVELLFGVVFDKNMNGKIKVTLVATGIEEETEVRDFRVFSSDFRLETDIKKLREFDDEEEESSLANKRKEDLDIPTFLRRQMD